MRVKTTNAWRCIATACSTAMHVARDIVRAYPSHLPVLIHIFGVGDLSDPGR